MSINIKINAICNDAIMRIARGNTDALSDIYDSVGKQIYFIAYSVLNNHHDAEDVLSEVLCEIAKNAYTYRPMSNARAWIFSIARNQALKYARDKNTSVCLDDIENEYACDMSFMSDLTMFDALKCLSSEEERIVLLHIESGLKFREISEILNITSAAAQKRYQRALKKLKKYYSK